MLLSKETYIKERYIKTEIYNSDSSLYSKYSSSIDFNAMSSWQKLNYKIIQELHKYNSN